MTLNEKITEYTQKYNVLSVVNLDHLHTLKTYQQESWLRDTLQALHRTEYENNQRIVFTLTRCNYLSTIIKNLQYWLFKIDITNFFVVLLTNDPDAKQHWESKYDNTEITFDYFQSDNVINVKQQITSTVDKRSTPGYQYNSSDLVKKDMSELSEQEHHLLTQSKTFCMYPWVHLHAYPTGETYPCCSSIMQYSLGNAKTHTLKEIWNSPAQKQLRVNMLNETASSVCNRCYEQEDAGFFSMRRSINKHQGHNINRIQETNTDGHLERFEMTYWDIRFSNLCNLKCRSCGHIFSSQWYQDQAKLAGGDWKEKNTVLNYAGRTETDMWEQLIPHLDYVEQIYFAGGEPLLMEEHYNILDELVKRKRFDVKLVYNTNFTHTQLKDRSVFEYWKLFDSIAVGASLDGSGAHAEYIRKGTVWSDVEHNRRTMMQVCPRVDFYISSTMSIMNAWHLPDFHRSWVEAGLIKPGDYNVNILQDPAHYRIDIAPAEYKARLQEKYQLHLKWLQDRDSLQRATTGFESAITFMNATDNTHLIDTFWRKTHELDSIRNENCLDVIPELKALK